MKSLLRWLAPPLFSLMVSCNSAPQYAFAQTIPAPVWVKVAVESNTVSTSTTVTWRYGIGAGITSQGVDCSIAPGCWTTPIASTIGSVSISGAFSGSDPANGLVKELDVLETATMQSVTVNGAVVIVPGNPLITPTPTVYSPTYRAGSIYPIAFSKISVITGSPAAAVLATFPIPAYQFVSGVLQNFNMTVNIGVVPFSCTYAATTTAGVITMNCSPVQK